MHSIRIDRAKPLAEEPHLGHNRYHPDIAPVAEIGEGEEIALETRDSLDGQIKPATVSTVDDGAIGGVIGIDVARSDEKACDLLDGTLSSRKTNANQFTLPLS